LVVVLEAGTNFSPMSTATPDSFPRVPLSDIDLSSPEFWLADRAWREGAFRTLRDEKPFAFFEERVIEDAPFPPGPGYYAVTRHDDIWQISRNPQLFCSGKGSNIGDLPVEMNEFFGSMINMDDPKHFRLRNIVSRGFTPKEVSRIEDQVRDRAAKLVTDLIERFPNGECDFVEEVAAALPLAIICDMMGIPEEDHKKIFHWTNVILGVGDPEFVGSYEDLMTVALEMFMYAQALGESRVGNPQDDVTSAMMNAVVDGERLTPQ
jgi:cytochrome P450